jgi:hypothetical protein
MPGIGGSFLATTTKCRYRLLDFDADGGNRICVDHLVDFLALPDHGATAEAPKASKQQAIIIGVAAIKILEIDLLFIETSLGLSQTL